MITRTDGRSDDDMATAVKDNIEIKIDAIRIIEHVRENYSPSDVYDEDVLSAWATANGFTKDEN